MGLLLSRPVFQRYIMKRLALILLMLGMIAGAAIPQMTPTFTGKLYKVTVDVSGQLIEDDELTMRKIMARQ